MIKNEDDFKKLIGQLDIDSEPNPAHRENLRRQMLSVFNETKQKPSTHIATWQTIRRTIMKSQITKLATAAVVILIALFGITLLDKSVTPAWAIEDTAEALDQFNALYISGVAAPSLKALEEGFDTEIVAALGKLLQENRGIPVEFWARANEERTRSGNIRARTPDGIVGVADDTKTYIYDPNSNTVYVQQGSHIMINPWLSGDFLLKVQEGAEDWQVVYGKDAATGRKLAFITCTFPTRSYSMWVEIDLETNLPVRYKIWHNIRQEGIPAYDMQRIVFFEQLPDELFEFEIPEDATIIEK